LQGREGDGYITTSGKVPSLYTDTLIPSLREGAEKAGRRLTNLDLLMEFKVSFDPDAQRALTDCRHWGALALSPEEKVGVEDPIEMQRLADALPIERAASRFIVSSDPDEHVEAIRRYIDLGFTHLVFHAPGADQERFLRVYGDIILPRLRKIC
jgi:coenzyme F420-dependent glucose-6-phosphate dehydrogenase